MILRIMGIEEDIEFDDYHDTLLIVQDPNFYATLLTKINQISKGMTKSNEIVLLHNDKNILSDAELLLDPFNIDLNSKKLLTSLYKTIESNLMEDENHLLYFEKINNINLLVDDYISEYNLEYTYQEELPFSEYLKSINLKLAIPVEATLKENLINYLEIMSELLPNKVFIFSNLLAYFSKEDIIELCKYKNYKHIPILFIENHDNPSLNFKRYVIDQDLYLYKK